MFHEVIYSRIHGGLVWLVKRLSSCRVFSTANTATTSCSCVVCWMYGFINALCMPLFQACTCVRMYMYTHIHVHVHTTLNYCVMLRVTHMNVSPKLDIFRVHIGDCGDHILSSSTWVSAVCLVAAVSAVRLVAVAAARRISVSFHGSLYG